MKRLLLILVSHFFLFVAVHSQSFTVDDLISLTTMPPKNIDRFMGRNKFVLNRTVGGGDVSKICFVERVKSKRKDEKISRFIELYKEKDSRYSVYHTTVLNEYLEGQRRLIKEGFFYDKSRNISPDSSMLFQKRNLAIKAISEVRDSIREYSFVLQERDMPDISDILYAEDLLRFTSHEFLVSFFGEKNVQKDMYYFSETELKKCSVLFGKSNRQVVFVWNDQNNLTDLGYILVSNLIPTISAAKYDGVFSNNEWRLQNGIYAGMSINELIKLNESDFEVYGNPSEFAFMVKPANKGKVDFSNTAILLSCRACNTDRIFDKPLVAAKQIMRENLPMFVFDIIIYPPNP